MEPGRNPSHKKGLWGAQGECGTGRQSAAASVACPGLPCSRSARRAAAPSHHHPIRTPATMTPRERVLTALRRGQPDRVPKSISFTPEVEPTTSLRSCPEEVIVAPHGPWESSPRVRSRNATIWAARRRGPMCPDGRGPAVRSIFPFPLHPWPTWRGAQCVGARTRPGLDNHEGVAPWPRPKPRSCRW